MQKVQPAIGLKNMRKYSRLQITSSHNPKNPKMSVYLTPQQHHARMDDSVDVPTDRWI